MSLPSLHLYLSLCTINNAMTSITLSSLPSLATFTPNGTTSSSQSYVIPYSLFNASSSSSSSTSPIHLTVNLCAAPESYNQSDTSLFTAYTNDTYTYSSVIHGGFGNITAWPTKDGADLTVILDAGSSTSDGNTSYTFELGVTSGDTPWHIVNKYPLFAYEDSDNTSALLTSPTYPSALLPSAPLYSPFIALTTAVREDLSNSSCYIRNLSSLVSTAESNTTTTTRGVVQLAIEEGGSINETLREGTRIQYAVSELNSGANYSVWATQENGQESGSSQGNRLFVRQFFKTKTGTWYFTRS